MQCGSLILACMTPQRPLLAFACDDKDSKYDSGREAGTMKLVWASCWLLIGGPEVGRGGIGRGLLLCISSVLLELVGILSIYKLAAWISFPGVGNCQLPISAAWGRPLIWEWWHKVTVGWLAGCNISFWLRTSSKFYSRVLREWFYYCLWPLSSGVTLLGLLLLACIKVWWNG